MIGETVEGYCFRYDNQGMPTLETCKVKRTGSEDIFYEGDEDFTAVYVFGVSFFYHLPPALVAYLQRLEAEKLSHQMAIAYIEDEIERAKQIQQLEQENRDAS